MTLFHVIILAIIEGISEFLPISSTGHLILASHLLHVQQSEFLKSFEIIIQLGAIFAILILYFRTILIDKKTLKNIIAAFLPTAGIGFALYKFIKQYLLSNPWVVVIMLFLGGIALIVIEYIFKKTEIKKGTISEISMRNATLIGVAQSLSILPGVSRAAATIVGGQLVGLSRSAAVEFSFLLAIPTMAAATGLDLIKSNISTFTSSEWGLLLTGCFISFVTALIVVKFFLRYIQHHTFIPFGIYRIVVSILFYLIVIR
jgi:undecaprenyl-diphosphatase